MSGKAAKHSRETSLDRVQSRGTNSDFRIRTTGATWAACWREASQELAPKEDAFGSVKHSLCKMYVPNVNFSVLVPFPHPLWNVARDRNFWCAIRLGLDRGTPRISTTTKSATLYCSFRFALIGLPGLYSAELLPRSRKDCLEPGFHFDHFY